MITGKRHAEHRGDAYFAIADNGLLRRFAHGKNSAHRRVDNGGKLGDAEHP